MKPRIIVCGLGHTGHKIFCWLRQQGAIVVGISDRPIRSETSEVVVGNLQAASTLLAAGIQKAHTLVIVGNDDAVNLAVLIYGDDDVSWSGHHRHLLRPAQRLCIGNSL
jgi:Trk K+ transport system NAD-binding subunit